MNERVEAHLARSGRWRAEMSALRGILLACGLAEDLKWGKPCYAHDGRNIAIVQQMKDHLALMFFRGALMPDAAGVLVEQGPNSRSARRMVFTSTDDVAGLAEVIPAYVAAAIAVEDAGLRAGPAPEPEPVPELRERLDADPALAEAFAALTPGRRREYHLHFAEAKRPATRAGRVENCVPRILAGKGLRDR